MAADQGLGLEITELRLGIPGGVNEKKRVFSEISGDWKTDETKNSGHGDGLVGWPPVCSYRKRNSFFNGREGPKMYVKVSMDGAPFLRKIDLSTHKEYCELVVALENLFSCSGISEALEDADSCEYVPIYEDKDGDWMLLGDVPWEMFTESCKRLRIMKRSDAKGIGLYTKSLLKGLINEKIN